MGCSMGGTRWKHNRTEVFQEQKDNSSHAYSCDKRYQTFSHTEEKLVGGLRTRHVLGRVDEDHYVNVFCECFTAHMLSQHLVVSPVSCADVW